MKRWQHYGIAISIAWAMVVTVYIRYMELPKAKEYATHAYYACTERKAASGNYDFEPCLQKVGSDWDEWMNRQWGSIAEFALLPIAAGWAVAFAALYLSQKRKSD